MFCSISDPEVDDLFDEAIGSTSLKPSCRTEILVTWITLFLLALQRKHLIPDVAIEELIKFLKAIFKILSSFSSDIATLYDLFPTSMLKRSEVHKNDFTTYVVRIVLAVHYMSMIIVLLVMDCLEKVNFVMLLSVKSDVISFCWRKFIFQVDRLPFVPLKFTVTIVLKSPFVIYWIVSIFMMNVKGSEYVFFKGLISISRIYDGRMRKRFQHWNGKPFLSENNTYAMMINVDWFQPFKRAQYSLGAIYLAVINLPHHLVFRPENTSCWSDTRSWRAQGFYKYFCKAPSWWNARVVDGATLQILQKSLVIRSAIICVACDLPAVWKVAGFLSYSATVDCSRCYKTFPGGAGKKNYSGLENWKKRTVERHRRHVTKIEMAKTVERKNDLIKKCGCRYSELLRLPYFDPVEMTVIDPMHCMYLGFAKHVIKRFWIEGKVVPASSFQAVQNTSAKVIFPSSIGHIPKNPLNSFPSFIADQLKNWTNIFSLFSMREALKGEHWECWKHFVLASRICQKQLTERDIVVADGLLLQFWKRVERIYGEKYITPNMHLVCRLQDCIRDFGPLQSFWLFPFERYNGIIEIMPSNKRMIEAQFMHRFLRDMKFLSIRLPTNFSEDLSPHFTHLLPSVSGSLFENQQQIHHVTPDTNNLNRLR